VNEDAVKQLEDELKYYRDKLDAVSASTLEIKDTNAALTKDVAELKAKIELTKKRDAAFVDFRHLVDPIRRCEHFLTSM
jgi:phage shock protein A